MLPCIKRRPHPESLHSTHKSQPRDLAGKEFTALYDILRICMSVGASPWKRGATGGKRPVILVEAVTGQGVVPT